MTITSTPTAAVEGTILLNFAQLTTPLNPFPTWSGLQFTDVVTSTPSVAFAVDSSNGTESSISANLDVVLSPVSGQQITVGYTVTGGNATGGGVDYTLVAGTLTFIPGDTGETISINIVDDALDESDETVVVTLSNPSNASLGATTVHTFTINDNDPSPTVAFAVDSSNGTEGSASANLEVVLSPVPGQQVAVGYTVTGGNATGGGVDYTLVAGILTFIPGDISETISISIVDDALDESDETVVVTLSNPSNASLGATTVHTFTIKDNDLAAPPPADESSDDDDDQADFDQIFGGGTIGGGGQPPAPPPVAPEEGLGSILTVADQELDSLQEVLEQILGPNVQVTGNLIEISGDPGPTGNITATLPVSGVPSGPLDGDFNFTLGSLSIETINGQTTATIDLGGGATITGSKLVGTPEGGMEVILENPRLNYSVGPIDVATLPGGSQMVTQIGAYFSLSLKRMPPGITINSTFDKKIGSVVIDAGTKMDQLAGSLGGNVGDLDEDVAFTIRVEPAVITNDDLGDNHTTLEVSEAWYTTRLSEGKRIFLIKFNDAGDALPPPLDVTGECATKEGRVACTGVFAGNQSGFSAFALVALSVASPTDIAEDLKPIEDNVVRVWHFSNATKSWSFYDPRPAFAAVSSIEKLATGQVYWVWAKEDQALILNGRERSLFTGWNVLVW